jgi:hypothetical protein
LISPFLSNTRVPGIGKDQKSTVILEESSGWKTKQATNLDDLLPVKPCTHKILPE